MNILRELASQIRERLHGESTDHRFTPDDEVIFSYELNNVCALVTSGLTKKELRRLGKHLVGSETATYQQFVSANKKSDLADFLFGYMQENSQIEPALAWIHEHLPHKYEKYEPFYDLDTSPIEPDEEIGKEANQPGEINGSEDCVAEKRIDSTQADTRPTKQKQTERQDQEALDRRQKRLIYREIREELSSLTARECEVSEIAELICRYGGHPKILLNALGPSYLDSSHTAMIRRYLSGETSELDEHIVAQQLLLERRSLLEDRLPNPAVFPVETDEYGPKVEAVTLTEVRLLLRELLGEGFQNLEIKDDFPVDRIGEHLIYLEFSDGVRVPWTIRLELQHDELPPDCREALPNVLPIEVSETEDVLEKMKIYLAEASPKDILEYYPRVSAVLATAYRAGYWKNTWVQDLLSDWRRRQDEYRTALELSKVRELVERLDRSGPWQIPEEDDTEDLDGQRVIEVAQEAFSTSKKLSRYEFDFVFDGDTSESNLSVEVLWNGRAAGTLNLLRVASYLPTDIHKVIKRTDTDGVGDLTSTSREQLLKAADRETSRALKIVDGAGHIDYRARARRLASICHTLLERGEVESIQFKRTLTCYYAAKGGELFDSDVLGARRYYLLFFRMLYREKMLAHLKAIREFDYPVLAAFFATYLSQKARKTSIPNYRQVLGKDYRQLRRQAPMLWRAAQLGAESRQSLFAAMLELYLIDDNFVCTLLDDLRQIRGAGPYDLGYLSVGAQSLPRDVVAFLFERVPHSIPDEQLSGFLMAVLGTSDIAQQVLEDFNRVLIAARKFVAAQDVVQKSTLYTDVDREFLQTRRVVDRLIGTRLRLSERTRKRGVPLRRLLQEIKKYVDRTHRDFFKSARLQVRINTFELPRDQLSPVELQVVNTEVGPANKIAVKIENNSTLRAKEYRVQLEPLFGKEKRVEALWILPLSDKAVELRGAIEYSDQESQDKTKQVPFQSTIRVSDPKNFVPYRSPYISGDPVRNSEMFFGRREELDEIVRLLRGHYQDRITVIHGQRRIGKTSILWQFKDGDPELLKVPALKEIRRSYLPVLVDFERLTEESPTWQIYQHIYKDIRRELDLVDIHIDQIPITSFRDLPADALLEGFIVDAIQLLDSKDLRLLLMFDEFDTLIRNKGEERGLFGFLREMIIKYGRQISFLFVGADELVEMMKTRTNRLYDMASGTVLKVQDLTLKESRQLIVQPMSRANPEFEWAEGAVQLIIHLTAGNPYYIQTLCDRVVNSLIAGKRSRATTIDVELGAKKAANTIGTLADIVKRLSCTPERVVLTCIADITRHERLERVWVTASQIEQHLHDVSPRFPWEEIPGVLRTLQERYILDQRETSEWEMEYSIRVPLLRMYIQNSLKLGDVLREGGYV